MKSTVLFCVISLASAASFAQETKSSLSIFVGNAPWDFKIGWYEIDNESFDDHDVEQYTFSFGLKYQRTSKENIGFRMRVSCSRINLHEYQSTDLSYDAARSTQTKFQFAPGATIAMTQKKFTVFGGFELPVYFHGKVKSDFVHKFDYPQQSVDERYSSVIPSGLTAGIAPLAGFTYNISKTIFCESEFSMLCLYGKTGGKTTTTHEGVTNVSSTQDSLQGIFFEPRIALGVGIRFGRKEAKTASETRGVIKGL